MLLNQNSKRLLNQLNQQLFNQLNQQLFNQPNQQLFNQPYRQLFKQPNKRLLPQSHNRLRALLLALMTLSATLAFAQPTYPDKTVRMVVPYPTSGGADILARAIGQKLTATWGQTVVIENKAGAGGSIGTDQVSKAPADGYTLLMASPSHAINGALYKNLSFDPEKNFTGVVLAASGPLVLVVNSSSPINSVQEFIALARAKPGSINYASAGVGSSPHLAGELLALMANIQMTHIAYKGTGPALTDLMGGQVQAFFGPVPALIEHIKNGRLKALGVTTPQAFAAIPTVPPIARDVPGYSVLQWWGIVTPTGTPTAVITKINRDVAAVLQSDEMKKQLAAMGAEPGGQSPQQFDVLIREEVVKWTEVIEKAKLKAE
jgi:tripartite-type tricarboxylate transporter receptor subunit TctC